MKLYCFYTLSCKILIDKYFMPSLKDAYEIVFQVGSYKGRYVSFKKELWSEITCEKIDFVIKAVQDSWNKIFLFSDPDVQFIDKVDKHILRFSKNQDLVFQRNNPWGMLCSGFFACKGNDKTLKFWRAVRDIIRYDTDDQDAANILLIDKRASTAINPDPLKHLYLKTCVTKSRIGMNPYGIRWAYFPVSFCGGGTLVEKEWFPGDKLLLPKNLLLHHANYTKGLENKLAQLKYVKEAVASS